MSKKARGPTFAEIRREAESAPKKSMAQSPPGLQVDGTFVNPEGSSFREVDDSISAARAHELASAGASVVWDPCACRGYCGYSWYTANAVKHMVAAGPPLIRNNKRHIGNISEWRSDADEVLLLAEEYVRWGDFLWVPDH